MWRLDILTTDDGRKAEIIDGKKRLVATVAQPWPECESRARTLLAAPTSLSACKKALPLLRQLLRSNPRNFTAVAEAILECEAAIATAKRSAPPAPPPSA